MTIVYSLLIAFFLDCILGDPPYLYHPICLIGKLISFFEKFLRRIFQDTDKGLIVGGAVLNLLTLGVSFIVPYIILSFLSIYSIWFKFIVETFFCYQILAMKSLKVESLKVYHKIEEGNLEESRKFLSYIVGRDTSNLSFSQITKAVVETVAENTSDGVIAPMFFMFIGGAPLGFLYKAVNTLDSMVGYKNQKYLFFGRVSAIVDDIFNFIPARITGILMCIASFLLRYDYKSSFKIFCRDRNNHKSPNSAQSESAVAGALNIQLGGDAYYFGTLYKKQTIGDNIRQVESNDILKTIKIMEVSSFLALIIFSVIRMIVVIV